MMVKNSLRRFAKRYLGLQLYSVLSKSYKFIKSLINSALIFKGHRIKKPEPSIAPEKKNKSEARYINELKKSASLYAMEGKFSEALEKFNLVLEIKPNEQIKTRIADCLTGLGRYEEAIIMLKRIDKDQVKNASFIEKRIQHLENHISGENKTGKFQILPTMVIENIELNLDSVQIDVLDQLNTYGIAATSVDKLLGSMDLWNEGESEYERFINLNNVSELIHKVKACKNFDEDEAFKSVHVPTKITYDQFFGAMSNDHPIGAILSHSKILEIAWAYYGSSCKLRNPAMWVNPAINAENQSGKKGSQQWHRDQEDSSILKCFIYFSDVTTASGATEYVSQSCQRFSNPSFDFHPFPYSTGYPNQEHFKNILDKENINVVNASGKHATIVFLDTNGFHRGGYVKEGQRHIAMATFIRKGTPEIGNKLALNKSIKLTDLELRTLD